ncbi:Transcription factor protein [Melia azedarach]|uniref:Transcription factor protein n=1 Tax=Melia azedarach TaxID=155640 RepID=A0ACC1YGT9_MELAZ|nr:Transcription factor protein [Melia azedarach]
MYPSSSSSSSCSMSSSSQKQMGPSGLTRYVSAPGSLLTTAVDSVIGSQSQPSLLSHPHYFTAPGDSSSSSSFNSESTCKVNSSNDPKYAKTGLHRSYGFNEITQAQAQAQAQAQTQSSLVRQRSSPAGFLSHFASENGFSVTRETGNYNSQGGSSSGLGVSRLKSQLSFTGQDSLSQISEVSENGIDGVNSSSGHQNATHSYATTSFGMDSWENGNSIVFSAPSNKRTKTLDGDILDCLNALETQFSMPQTTLEMATVEKFLHIPEDSVPCKIRAKRGCATHPRSIAERERRTRISGKLKKLQELVPNMDKQTSYSDMLDLAVQHIKGLQNQVQKLDSELKHCTCGCNPNSTSSSS